MNSQKSKMPQSLMRKVSMTTPKRWAGNAKLSQLQAEVEEEEAPVAVRIQLPLEEAEQTKDRPRQLINRRPINPRGQKKGQ